MVVGAVVNVNLSVAVSAASSTVIVTGTTTTVDTSSATTGTTLSSEQVEQLPINGRDPTRGVPGNMSAAEAVDLASIIRPRFVVPHHYDMFTFNTVPASEFEAEAGKLPAGVAPRVLRCGERWEIYR